MKRTTLTLNLENEWSYVTRSSICLQDLSRKTSHFKNISRTDFFLHFLCDVKMPLSVINLLKPKGKVMYHKV